VRSRRASSVKRSAMPLGWLMPAFYVGLILAWEVSIGLFSIPRYILPKPSEIATRGAADLPLLIRYTLVTGIETLIDYVAAVVLAVPIGLTIAFSRILRHTLYPFCVSLEMTPKIAFAPLFISWLGFGMLPKVIIVFLVCFFPIVLNAILAFSLSEELTRFCRSTGASAQRTFMKVRLPAALPQLFVGFKYAAIKCDCRCDVRGVHRERPGIGLLHPDLNRQHAHGSRLRRHLPADTAGSSGD